MARVFVDTNVLFPFSIMDLMLALTEDHVHEVVWTETLLAEWERVIVREHRRSPESASAITGAIREFFADSQVTEVSYADLVDAMPGPDPDDHHHMAAAIAAHAHALVTWNRADFPAERLAEHSIEVIDPDTYLRRLLKQFPQEVVSTITRLATEKRRPPTTSHDLVSSLRRAGLARFSKELEARLGPLR